MPRKSASKRKPPSRSAKSKAVPKGAGDKEAQYARFLEAAREAEASKDPKDFDRAFKRVTSKTVP
ncbi:MAG: hypothetical protein JO208_11520 [Alphaproteobacteria bacterium]|nr:hypothetical protein [Alphaproteobacteria bacterium]